VDNPTWLLEKDGMKNFSLSHGDAQDKNDGGLRIKRQLANSGLPGK